MIFWGTIKIGSDLQLRDRGNENLLADSTLQRTSRANSAGVMH